jgi:hypothetical protein
MSVSQDLEGKQSHTTMTRTTVYPLFGCGDILDDDLVFGGVYGQSQSAQRWRERASHKAYRWGLACR